MALVTLRFQYTKSGVPSDAELTNLMGFAPESVTGPVFGDVRDVVVDDANPDAVAVATEVWVSDLGWTLIDTDPVSTIADVLATLISGSPKLRESGGAGLTLGAVADGELLKRSGTTVVGAAPDAPGPHEHDDTEVNLTGVIGTPTVSTLDAFRNTTGSPGIVTCNPVVDDGDGSITVPACTGFIRATDSGTAALLSYDVAETPITPTDLAITYVYVEYNAGTPQVVGTTTQRADHNTNNLVATVHREGTILHITPRHEFTTSGVHELSNRLVAVDGLAHEEGLVTSESGVRKIAMTSGAMWLGRNRYAFSAFDSNVLDTFHYYYQDSTEATGFASDPIATAISNTLWDDGSDTLASLTGSRKGVHWVFRAVDGDVYALYGRGNYTQSEAELAQPPANLPPHFAEHHAELAAKIIVSNGGGSFDLVESAFDKRFTGSLAADHADLSNVTPDQHHPQSHTVASHSDTTATGAQLNTLVGGADASALHSHTDLPLAGGTMAGAIDMGDQSLDNYQRARSNTEALGTTGAISIDCNAGNDFSCDPTANITGITVTNKPAAGKSQMLRIVFTQDATPRTIPTSWTGVDWWTNAAGGPVMPTGSGKTLIVTIVIIGGKKAIGSWVAEP